MSARQVDLEGKEVPVEVRTKVTLRFGWETDHYKISANADKLREWRRMDPADLAAVVNEEMRAQPNVRSLPPETVRDHALALTAEILDTSPGERARR